MYIKEAAWYIQTQFKEYQTFEDINNYLARNAAE